MAFPGCFFCTAFILTVDATVSMIHIVAMVFPFCVSDRKFEPGCDWLSGNFKSARGQALRKWRVARLDDVGDQPFSSDETPTRRDDLFPILLTPPPPPRVRGAPPRNFRRTITAPNLLSYYKISTRSSTEVKEGRGKKETFE